MKFLNYPFDLNFSQSKPFFFKEIYFSVQYLSNNAVYDVTKTAISGIFNSEGFFNIYLKIILYEIYLLV